MKKFLLILLLILPALLCGGAYAQTASSQKQKKAKLEKEIKILEDQLKANAKKSGTAATNLSLIQRKVSARKELLMQAESELKALSDSVRSSQAELDRVQGRLDTLMLYYSKLVRSAYKNRDSRVWFMYILASGDLPQATRRYSYLRNMSGSMTAQAVRIKETKTELEERKAELEVLQARARSVRDQRGRELGQLQKEQKDNEKIVAQLKKDKTRYQKQLADKKKRVEALNREIQRMIESNVNAARKSKKPVDTKLSAEFSSNEGKLPWPVEGAVVGRFGRRNHPVYKSLELPFNNGIDIATAPSATVSAVFDGVVKQVIVMPGYNQCVLVQHGGFFTFYCKLGSVGVKAGDKVKTGQAIGKVATLSNETQLHFQLWEGKSPQDPELWLR